MFGFRRSRSASPRWRHISIPVSRPTVNDLIREDLSTRGSKFGFASLFGSVCCVLHCLGYFTKFDITQARMCCVGDYETSRSNLLSILHCCMRKDCGEIYFDLEWRGMKLCDEGFASIFKISRKTLDKLKESVMKGETRVVHGNSFSMKSFTKCSNDRANLDYWLHENAQYHPVSGKMFLDARLPSSIIAQQCNIKSSRRVASMLRNKKKLISRTKCTLMTRCSVCSRIKCHMKRGQLSKEKAKHLMTSHMADVKNEREIINSSYARSLSSDECSFVSMDDMSNQATKLPNLIGCRSKMIPDNVLVRADMSAALWAKRNGSTNYSVDLFLDVANVYGAGSNATINFLLHSLRRFEKLPSSLFLQVDGAKSNKSKVFFMFLSHLVDIHLFQKITVMYLPVGHSHAFCDRFFGVIRRKLNESDQFTPSELTSAIVQVNGVRSVRHERMNFDMKSWIEPQAGNVLDGIFKNMYFEFEKLDGECLLRYRPLGSKTEGQKSKNLSSLSGEPNWIKRSTDATPINDLLACAHGELPDTITNNWKKVNDRVKVAPASELWRDVKTNLLNRRSSRVAEDEVSLRKKDKMELDNFLDETKKTKKRKRNTEDE